MVVTGEVDAKQWLIEPFPLQPYVEREQSRNGGTGDDRECLLVRGGWEVAEHNHSNAAYHNHNQTYDGRPESPALSN